MARFSYCHPVLSNRPRAELAAKVAAIAPGWIDAVYMVSGGSEAVETAIKIARQYHVATGAPEKHMVISHRDSYHGMTLGALKEIVRRCDLMVTNDTGPRHIAAAFDVPVVTVFGPTHPEWTEIYFPKERKVAVKVFCGPCQKKICPLDHRCMTRVTPAMVYDTSLELLGKAPRRVELPQAPATV